MHDDEPGMPPVGVYDRALERALAAALRHRRELLRRREQAAAALLAPVVAGERGWRSLPPREARAARTPALVELLLARSFALRHDDPAGMVELARLALAVALRLKSGRGAAGLAADLRARCWCELANACRVAHRFAPAWQALGQAAAEAGRGTGDPLLAGRMAELGASLLGDQRQFAAAEELLAGLDSFYRALGERHLAGRVALKRGHLAACAGEHEAALRATAGALADLDPERDPALPRLALQNLIDHATSTGRYRKARLMLWRARAAGRLPSGRLAALRLLVVEGRIAAGLGRPARAEAAFRQAREGFARAGSLFSAALAALDLGALLVEQGRRAEVVPLLGETLRAFEVLGIAREAAFALLLLRDACKREAVEDRVLREHFRLASLLLSHFEDAPLRRRRPAAARPARALHRRE